MALSLCNSMSILPIVDTLWFAQETPYATETTQYILILHIKEGLDIILKSEHY